MWRRAPAAVEIVAAILLGAALAAAVAGPLRLDLFGSTLSVRNVARPLIGATALLACRLWCWRRKDSAESDALAAISRVLTGALVAGGVIGWVTFLSPTVGGADSYGYVSAAERLLERDLVHREPLAAILPVNGDRIATPLGYVPSGRTPHASVPAYPLGLPAVMAVAIAAFGRSAPFFVAPLSGLLLIGAAYVTALAWYRDRATALLAGGLLALHPLVFTYAIQPMSDVPAAAALTAAVAWLARSPARPIAAGLAAGLTITIRPALAPAAFALALLPLALGGSPARGTAIRYGVLVAAGALIQGWTQWYLYGDPFASGYGRVDALFSMETAALNLRSYSYWGYLTLGPVWLAAAGIGLAASDRAPRVALALVAVAVSAPYLFYRPYDHWETLRFLLPMLVIATIVAAWGLRQVGQALAGRRGGALVAAVLAMAVTWSWMSWLAHNRVFHMPDHEARHRAVGDLVARVTPADAIVLALQHSGSVRYYAGRETLNWDHIPPGQFPATVDRLRGLELPVYLLIDSDEEWTMFRSRHGAVAELAGWLPGGQYRNVQLLEAPADSEP